MRRVLIAGNWKMNKNAAEAHDFISGLKEALDSEKKAEVLVCPPTLFVQHLVEETKDTQIKVGAQNAYFEKSGAFTGETSPEALADLGVDYIIIGHSERRQGFGETDEDINKKAKAIFAEGATPIICCGETLEQREAGEAKEFISGQIRAALEGLSEEQAKEAVIAYEPIWAIGTGKSASPEDAEEICAAIREVVADIYSADVAEETRILYGGSVKPATVDDILVQENIDGALVGGASLEVDSFTALVNAAE
ncbi:triose-phosphate isomerase [Aerococcus vaginalis]